ncbi:hypothetical protein IscW_ISCW021173, partial [Ixodes scapularis]
RSDGTKSAPRNSVFHLSRHIKLLPSRRTGSYIKTKQEKTGVPLRILWPRRKLEKEGSPRKPFVNEGDNISRKYLIYYAAGYAARKKISTSKCEECKALCLLKQCQVPETLPAAATKEWDMGGLLYPSKELYKLILTLENKLTQVFSTCKLHAGLMVDVVSALGGLPRIGCPEHAECLTKEVTKFYCVTRLHFFLKGKNKTDAEKKKKMQKNV